ncbi:hypothetical protein O0I10_007433 [Lichtheimia ornata]|uniref:Alginate lyase domain-containing protein n=1 Tax=Lichtheimia ornata TaxID=688661 RepID=A0AAD7V1K5_9FUNG|nr:uncharacterized protein O0I10_007433 [Lichtheimia ornata]KAJ8656836.1 hypothetical protein O0I10_007433 [Lichtheimia ornata]
MAPKKPEIEYIHLPALHALKQRQQQKCQPQAYDSLQKLAQGALKKGPFSITFEKSEPHIAASGDKRDFLSYAPYFWPSDKDKDKYVRRDGKRNPDCNLVKDQSQLEAFAENVTYLCMGYYLLGREVYVNHAMKLIDTFLVNEETRMNPNVDYGQVIRGKDNPTGKGRGEGIMSTRALARVANVLPLIVTSPAVASIAPAVRTWFSEYLRWLLESDIGKEEAAKKNNHLTWYLVQVAMIQQFLGDEQAARQTIENFFVNVFPKQVDEKGDQPHESSRTKPFHYLGFNLHAAIFLAELGLDIGYDAYQANPYLTNATKYMISTCQLHDPKEDPTGAVRTVEIVASRCGGDPSYCEFIDTAKSCKYSENIDGPKHALCRLWCPEPVLEQNNQAPSAIQDNQPSSTPQRNDNSISNNDNQNRSGSNKSVKGFIKQLFHHNN